MKQHSGFNQSPVKLVAFPKLINQIKESESNKSFLKINNISLNKDNIDIHNNSMISIIG
jgi:hypothetical protein